MLIVSLNLFSQKDVGLEASENITVNLDSISNKWQLGGTAGVFASQVMFVNWSGGGISSFTGILDGTIFAKYRKGKISWENDVKAEWGMIKNNGESIMKNRDILEINSKYGYQVDKKGEIFIGSLLKFGTQFTQGINEGDSIYTSNFMAPASLVMALGLNWKPKQYFSLFFAPAAGKFTFVNDSNIDATTYGLESGTKSRTEFGAYLKADFEKEILKNLLLKSTLTLFNNFLDNSLDTTYSNGVQKIKQNRINIDVDWTTGADLIFNEWLTVNISTQLVYDHDVKIALMEKDGKTPLLKLDETQKTGPRTQFNESFSIGVKYRFKPKEKK